MTFIGTFYNYLEQDNLRYHYNTNNDKETVT